MARTVFQIISKEQGMEPTESTQGARIVGKGDDSPGPGPELMAAGTLEGDDVVNLEGEKLGTIQDIMLDVPKGKIAYAVLSRGGVLGMGDKLFAIPWSALTLDTGRKCFILNVDSQRLEDAEGFDKDKWPKMADFTWASQIHEHYGQPTYW